MSQGIIFDVRELTVHDGPGIRTTVFFKGCPLRCAWCHNPEGLSSEPQLLVRTAGCEDCGLCRKPCQHPECTGLGRCTRTCPHGLVRRTGQMVEARALVARLLPLAEMLDAVGGGFTVSGGEPLAQPELLLELLELLRPHHRAVETSGYAPAPVFAEVMAAADLMLLDVKHMDPEQHRRGTGVDNAPILANLDQLVSSGRAFVARVPLIPGYNDSPENLDATAARLAPARDRVRVELLPMNPLAGAKYAMVGLRYRPPARKTEPAPRPDLAPFTGRGIEVAVL